jgi:hypothetical protein
MRIPLRSNSLSVWSRIFRSTAISFAGSMDQANKMADFPSFLTIIRDKIVRMSVPKMVKNGQNSAFAFESGTAPTRKTRKPRKFKTVLKAQKGIKTIFGQFRNKHAR